MILSSRYFKKYFTILSLSIFIYSPISSSAQTDTASVLNQKATPVTLADDTLFFVSLPLGPFSAEQRADAITKRIKEIIDKELNTDSLQIRISDGLTSIHLDNIPVMSITKEDAAVLGRLPADLAEDYVMILKTEINEYVEETSLDKLLINAGIAVLLLIGLILLYFGMSKIFPLAYTKLESWEGSVFRSIKFRTHDILSAENISSFFIFLFKGLRLVLSLVLLYYFIVIVLGLFPWTRHWDIRAILRGIFYSIVLIAAAIALFKAMFGFFNMVLKKIGQWKGTIIKPVTLKKIQLLSEDRIVELVGLSIKAAKFVASIVLLYFALTILFSFFDFSKTWAQTLIDYILGPLSSVIIAFVSYLPNLFAIIVIIFITRYVIKFIRFIFNEVERENVTIPEFPVEWAEPTFKIVRFLIIVFAVIVIFPYLPGSDSPIFRGISIFLGVLFSLGSTSAIANIVAGVVITYMRPFRIGDRVKIADTVGDVVEKTLLVTRVRTIKNVDITIPNSMVLGSHIINFSSSVKQKGLILHTTVAIGYVVPWKKVHELLISAAEATDDILPEPKPFVLQTSLDDFYVSYELNAYTDKPNSMTITYSDLHQNIQDKFNEAGVEIMSPHYSSIRDGNQTSVPEDYLPKSYSAPPFKILPIGDLLSKKDPKNKENK
jgi:small-conductance mechanosensitive channel